MDGHSGDVYHMAFHPALPHVFATVADSGHVHVWDSALRQMTHCAALGWDPRCVAFSSGPLSESGGFHVAVGGSKGHIKVCVCVSRVCYTDKPSTSCSGPQNASGFVRNQSSVLKVGW